jgi:hypothetical protein
MFSTLSILGEISSFDLYRSNDSMTKLIRDQSHFAHLTLLALLITADHLIEDVFCTAYLTELTKELIHFLPLRTAILCVIVQQLVVTSDRVSCPYHPAYAEWASPPVPLGFLWAKKFYDNCARRYITC